MRTEYAQQSDARTVFSIRRHPIVTFAALSITFGWLPLVFSTTLPYVPLALLSASAPLLATFIISTARKEVINIRVLTQLPSGIQWYICLLIPVLWGGIVSGLQQLFPDGRIKYPLVALLSLSAALIYIFEKGELIVWRGYVLPKLAERNSRPGSSLLVSGLALVIYLPLFITGTLVEGTVFPASAVFIVSALTLYVWLWHLLRTSSPLKKFGTVRTFLRSMGRGLLAGFVAVFALLGTAYIYQSVLSRLEIGSFPPPGQMVAVDGHQMHILCTGQGSPTVILEAGAFSFSREWYVLQKQIEQTNHVCSYDRAGNGWSEAVAGSRDGLTLVRELHALLEKANIPGPYVLAGHSLGGVLDVIYASQYPSDVLGVILVDPAVPSKFTSRDSYDKFVVQNQSAYVIVAALARVGLVRPVVNGEFQVYGYPTAVIPELTALKAKSQGVDTWDAEVRLAQWDLYQQLQAAANLGRLPVVVLWASHPEITAPADRERLQDIWALLPIRSSNKVVRVVDGATHGSIIGQPEYVTQIYQAVQDVIRSATTGNLLQR